MIIGYIRMLINIHHEHILGPVGIITHQSIFEWVCLFLLGASIVDV